MRRFKIPDLLLGCLLTVAIFATGALFAWRPEATNARGDIAEQNATKKGDGTKSPDSELVGPTWLTKDAAGFFAFISALVVGGQAVMFFIQLRYMRIGMREATIAAEAANNGALAATDSARIARNAVRPYLTPFGPELRNWTKAIKESNPDQVLSVYLDITNIGTGVGFVKSYGIIHEIRSSGEPGSVAPQVRDGMGRMPLRPDAVLETEAAFYHFQISAGEQLAIIKFKKALYVYGYVRYFDFFGIFRRTGFMFEFIAADMGTDKDSFIIRPHPMWYDEEKSKIA